MESKDNKTEVITLRVTSDMKKKLQTLADKDHRTLSNYILAHLERLTIKQKG